MPNVTITIFPRLLNSGKVRCCNKGLDDCFAAHRTVREKTFNKTINQINMVIVLNTPTNA